MGLVVVADPDLRERMRCIRIVADQTPASALGAASWPELTQVLDDVPDIGLVLFAPSLSGAPEDALAQLLPRAKRVVLTLDAGEEAPSENGVTRLARPVPEESLVMMARSLIVPSAHPHASFMPVDFLQMICMSGGSHILVLNREGSDVGVIEVRSGEVWTAFDALGVGEDAFARLIRPEMRARVSSASGSRKERTIFKGLHELVLESLRRIDEGRVPLPESLSAAQMEAALATPEQLAVRVKQLNDDARRLLMTRSYDEAARVLLVLSELDPGSHLVRANLEQLRKLGFSR
ncbi:MAG: DUF4388 domain-containing protein [Myxococcales bacterium]|nr:MAG: DUF4388 domain-containing protein [Myxococcales bacterium]